MKKIGLLGGTFDPIHIGHLLLGQWAQEEFDLDEIWFLPAGNPYFKKERKIASEQDRLEMTRLAVSGTDSWKVCDVEIGRGGNTYTYETVELLKKDNPEHEFFFIFGSDCLNSLEHWRYPERILAGCHIIAAARGMGEKNEDIEKMRRKAQELAEKFGGKIFVMNFPAIEISSTLIRGRIAEGKNICYMVPGKVETYLTENELYRMKT